MRPAGKIPQWATDAIYPAGAAPWNAQPNKVDPGLSQTAEGYEPGQRTPAQWDNWFKNKSSIFLAQNDAIEVQNWKERQLIQNSGPLALTQLGVGKRIGFDPVTGKFWIAGVGAGGPGSATLLNSINGVDWVDDAANLPAAFPLFQNLAINPADGYMYANSDVKCMSRHQSGAPYTNFLLPGGTGAKFGCAFDIYSTKFVWWGLDAAPNPALWAGFETFGSIVQQNLQNMNTFNGASAVHLFAAGPTRKVCFVITTAPTGSQRLLDTAAYGAVWTDRGAVGFTGTAKALAYGDADALFMVVDSSGLTYVSANGIAWTTQSDNSGLGWAFLDYCLEAHGGIWTAAITMGGVKYLVWSKDAGVTWNRIPCLLDQTKAVGSVQLLDDRMMALDAGGNISYALRAR